jgi:hypothetical protein
MVMSRLSSILPPRTKWTRRVPHPVLTGHAFLPFLGQVVEVWLEDEETDLTASARVAAPRVRARPDRSAKRAWGAREGGAAAGAAEGARAGVEGRRAAPDADAPEATREIERGEEQGIKVGPDAGPSRVLRRTGAVGSRLLPLPSAQNLDARMLRGG